MATDRVTVVSADPFIIAVSISPKRYIHKLILRYKEFMVSVPTIEILKDVWLFGLRSGPDKLSEARVTLEKPVAVSVPLIKEAVANLECKVIGMHDYGITRFS